MKSGKSTSESVALLRTVIGNHFGLTPREIKSVLVLTGLLLLGCAVRYAHLFGVTAE